jgi:alginate O-acetyltransferase complex protein AlgI
MLFASFDFLLFFLPVLAAYWLLASRPKARLLLLLGASYFFYTAAARPPGGGLPTGWYYVGLLGLTTVIDFVLAQRIEAIPLGERRRKLWLTLSLICNLGLLAYFKYTNFGLSVVQEFANALGIAWVRPMLSIALPIGVSFYTFQSLSYTIDVYRGHLKAERNFLRFAVFVAFFPQLVAGPIVRAVEFLPQFHMQLSLDAEAVDFAAWRIMRGLFKKVVFADFIAAYFTDVVFSSPQDYSQVENLLALYAFTLQIYADFSGYSDIAIGAARLLGFHIPENFDRPYQATSVAEFWRRWHMTLSTWLRDYLFFPLGGSRGTAVRTYFNLGLTMFLVGMWHGASWNFVVYSLLQASAMVFNRFARLGFGGPVKPLFLAALVMAGLAFALAYVPLQLGFAMAIAFALVALSLSLLIAHLPEAETRPWWAFVHVALTFHFVSLSRLFFRSDDLEKARVMARQLVTFDAHGVRPGLFKMQGLWQWANELGGVLGGTVAAFASHGIFWALVVGFAYHFAPKHWVERPAARFVRLLPGPLLGVFVAGVAWLGLVLLSGPRANIYFSF